MAYAIKTTYIATKNNPNKDYAQIWYIVKGGKSSKELDWYIKENAYTTKAAVTKGLKALQRPFGNTRIKEYWDIKYEVVEV